MMPFIAAGYRQHFWKFLAKAVRTVAPGDAYQPNWHIDAIIEELNRVTCGQEKRLLINQPPRSLKSITISVAYVAWRIGRDPSLRAIVASYSAELAAELHRQFRMIVQSPWYRQIFPNVVWHKETNFEFVTSRGGGRYAASVGGTLTGRGADLIIIDDPLNASDSISEVARRKIIEWFTGTLLSRLNDKTRDPIIVVAQRLHEDDLPGHLLRAGGWKHLCLPAIATEGRRIAVGQRRFYHRRPGEALHPERTPLETLEQIRAEIGSLKFSAQYQQQPVSLEGNLVLRTWFKGYSELPQKMYNMRLVQSWDVAATTGSGSDYSACITALVGNGDYYIVNVFRALLVYPDLRRKVIALAEEYQADTLLIEDAGFGLSLKQDLINDKPAWLPYPIGMKPNGSKMQRLEAQTAKIEKRGMCASRKRRLGSASSLYEVLAFPNGRHDDQVDALSQLLDGAANFSDRRTYRSSHQFPNVFFHRLAFTPRPGHRANEHGRIGRLNPLPRRCAVQLISKKS